MITFNTTYTQLPEMSIPWTGEQAPSPTLLYFNADLAQDLGLDEDYLKSDAGLTLLTGGDKDVKSVAMAYSGHQFGNFVPRLGDGRALLLGEIMTPRGERKDLHLKGSGATPFSRGGDGKAVLGPVLREYLIGEFMHAVGIPTTRGLAVCTTGETHYRRTGVEPGAVLTRVAGSHLRIGSFQFAVVHQDDEGVQALADYAIKRHDPDLIETEDKYLAFYKAVIQRQAQLIARWMGVGFVHGVMNTDNTTISGETIDYGPCAFIDHYDPMAVFSSIDYRGRYAYANQPLIIQWNLARLGECLLPLIDADKDKAVDKVTEALEGFSDHYKTHWLALMHQKLGLESSAPELIQELFQALDDKTIDYTLFFRELAQDLRGQSAPIEARLGSDADLNAWLAKWREQMPVKPDKKAESAQKMDAVNPVYIPRNHLLQEALDAAAFDNDFGLFDALLERVKSPFEAVKGQEEFSQPAPKDAPRCVTYCGT